MDKSASAHVGDLFLEKCALQDKVEGLEKFIYDNLNRLGRIVLENGILDFEEFTPQEVSTP